MLLTRAASDSFVKVRVLIKELIARLKEEAVAEAEHKVWCDAELQTNNQTQTEKSQIVFKLHADVNDLPVNVQKLTQEISDLGGCGGDQCRSCERDRHARGRGGRECRDHRWLEKGTGRLANRNQLADGILQKDRASHSLIQTEASGRCTRNVLE